MKELVKFIAQSLVDNPDAVQVTKSKGSRPEFATEGGQGRSWEGDRQAGAHRPSHAHHSERRVTKIRKRAVLEIIE